MSLNETLERPADDVFMPLPPAWQKQKRALEDRVARLTAELERQQRHLWEACGIAEHIRGLSLMFHGVFCETTLTENPELVSQRNSAAFVFVDCLEMLAQRLQTTEGHADASRREALAEAPRC